MDELLAVRHDCTSLYTFVENVAARCATGQHLSYPDASQTFFSYVVGLSTATKVHLGELILRLDSQLLQSDPDDFRSQAREIATLRSAWYWLHRFVKPALDAHTLESPLSLVEALATRLRLVHGFENVQFAILHTADLNYFQLKSSSVREIAEQVRLIIDNAPSFPPDLALVAIPYSQAGSVFLNIALAHEMGHFAFQRLHVASEFQRELISLLGGMSIGHLLQQDFARCADLVLGWLEEIYCDLFAVYLAGPSFCFAFVDLLNLIHVEPSPQFEFSHPAPALRLRQQARMLMEPTVGWWQTLAGWNNCYTRLLTKSAGTADGEFLFTRQLPNGVADLALKCFLSLVEKPREAISALFAQLDSGAGVFRGDDEDISSYLSAAVVPSRLVRNGAAYSPSTVSLLSSCYLFYSDSLDRLLTRLAIADVGCLECRALWAARLEMWLAKALEDVNTNGYSVTVSTQ